LIELFCQSHVSERHINEIVDATADTLVSCSNSMQRLVYYLLAAVEHASAVDIVLLKLFKLTSFSTQQYLLRQMNNA